LYTTGSNLTGDLAQLATTLKDEINKFNACKSGIVYNEITLNIGKNTYTLNMPTFKKDTVKTIVNAFTLLIMNKVEKDTKLTTTEVTEITKKFDNFLVILKLIRDDDNSCKQNLSTYHITQFTHAMQEYNLDVGE